ncbi:MAG TPA: CDP-alcohol phosphatidyltransferase family protein [Egibacteraceae bacterium]|nr:CDP-alcohol phosphatidyltransferase family protein [Actinomycetota bacterium]HWB72080.1 CDP-alcohol phosphatidyltransferase family protein [Egibacteraceae bacterium]
MTLNAHARALTDRVVIPVASSLVRLGVSANRVTFAGLAFTLAGVGVVLAGAPRAGAWVITFGVLTDALDGTVARLRGEESRLGAFFDSAADRVGDAAIFGAVAWLVRDDPLLFTLAVVALSGALITSYVRAKAESLGWRATVGLAERPERLLVVLPAIHFDLLAPGLWLLAVGSVVTVAQRTVAVCRQARAER